MAFKFIEDFGNKVTKFIPANWYNSQKAKAAEAENNAKMAWGFGLTDMRTFSVPFNGSKNPGLSGPAINYSLDHQGIIVRAWQAVVESAPAKIGINRRVKWLIGKGLKLQSEPLEVILNDEGIKFDRDKFIESVEAGWKLFSNLKSSDYARKRTLNQQTKVMQKNADVAGDVLIVLRVIKGQLKIQLIDGAHVQSPMYGTEHWPQELPSGNLIVDGVEMNGQREHIAYWVKTYAVEATMSNLMEYRFERVEARGKRSGMLMAYLFTGDEFRIDTTRGMSRLGTMTEKLTNLDTYSNATLNQAKEAAKVDYQVVSDKDATGNAPWAKDVAKTYNRSGLKGNDSNPETDDGVQKRNIVHVTGIGDAYNNSPGSKIEMLENKNPLYFKDFNDTHRDEVFAELEIPPDVAMSKYTNSYSASRASVKDWEHTLIVGVDDIEKDGIKPIFDLWLDLEILTGRIQAPGYMIARMDGNQRVLEAYRCIRMVGPKVPHIDPYKEAMAARVKLGDAGASVPLGDPENIAEELSGADFNEILKQFGKYLKKMKELDIRPEPVVQQVKGNGSNEIKVDEED